jgi:hypothetical protein
VLFRVFAHEFEQYLTVGIGLDDGLAVVAPLNDVVGISGNGEAREAGHGVWRSWEIGI